MAGFLDFVESFVPGGAPAVPSWLTGLLVKKPKFNPEASLPYYQAIAGSAGQANEFADSAADFTRGNYMPAAVNFNARAQGVGHGADLDAAADRNAANFRHAFDAKRASATRSMAGVNPNSGAARARMGAIDASFAPGMVHALNTGRREREVYGDNLRKDALGFLNMQPNYGPGMSGYALAGRGMQSVGDDAYKRYRDEAGDVVKALKLPGDRADEQGRQKKQQETIDEIFGRLNQRFFNPNYDSNGAFTPSYSGGTIDDPDYG